MPHLDGRSFLRAEKKIPFISMVFIMISCGRMGNPIAKDAVLPLPPAFVQGWNREDEAIILWGAPYEKRGLSGFEVECRDKKGTLDVEYRVERIDELYIAVVKNFKVNGLFQCRVYSVNPYGKRGGGSDDVVFQVLEVPEAEGFEVIPQDRSVEIILHSDGNSSFNIYRDNSILPLNDTPLKGRFVDSPLENRRVYKYRIRRVLKTDCCIIESKAGDEKEVIPEDHTPPAEISSPILAIIEGGVRICWDPSPSEDIDGYNLYSFYKGKWIRLNDTIIKDTCFLKKGAKPLNRFKITSVDKSGNESKGVPVR